MGAVTYETIRANRACVRGTLLGEEMNPIKGGQNRTPQDMIGSAMAIVAVAVIAIVAGIAEMIL